MGQAAHLHGRSNGLSQPISAATAGAVAGSISISETFQLYGFLTVLVTAVTYFLLHELRNANY